MRQTFTFKFKFQEQNQNAQNKFKFSNALMTKKALREANVQKGLAENKPARARV